MNVKKTVLCIRFHSNLSKFSKALRESSLGQLLGVFWNNWFNRN